MYVTHDGQQHQHVETEMTASVHTMVHGLPSVCLAHRTMHCSFGNGGGGLETVDQIDGDFVCDTTAQTWGWSRLCAPLTCDECRVRVSLTTVTK